jgi:hypothetical protein
MSSTPPRSRRRRYLKWLLITVGVLAFAVIGLHIWFVRNARSVLMEMVSSRSNGRLKLELSEVSFNLFSNKLKIREADLMSIDSLSQPTTYHVKFRKLTVRVASFWPLLLEKRLLLDSIKLHDPEIEVFQWREDTTTETKGNGLSITQQMGRLYNSMLDGLDAFGIRRVMISNAKLSLVNKMDPAVKPVVVSKIYFNIFRTAEDAKKRDEFVVNEQEVELHTTDQSIDLPNGRHRLAFRKFELQLFKKRVALEGCTLTALPTDSASSSYTIFFNKLLLIGVDFDAMYRYNLIRADSVYCQNPLFDITLNPSDAKKGPKERPDPGKIVRELTGDLDLAFVGVKDAGIHFNITGKKNRTLFNSNKDDFEMRGLRINADSAQPVVVKQFDMLVRDYRLYNEDSSSAFSFDSIHFLNNRVVLNNFTVATQTRRGVKHDERDFTIPYFELRGLDWYELIFEQNLQAQEASLHNAVIRYVRRKPAKGKKTNFYNSLQTLDDLMTLHKLNIYNGQVSATLGPSTSMQLENVNLGLFSDRLLKSTDSRGLRSAVDRLSFSKGRIRLKDMTVQLYNVASAGKNLVHADRLTVSGSRGSISATASDVSLDNLLLDDERESIVADGIRWGSANVTIKSLPAAKRKKNGGSLELRNVSGANTRFRFTDGKSSVSTFISRVKLTSLSKNGAGPMQTSGLELAGNDLSVNSGPMKIRAAGYSVQDGAPSLLTALNMSNIKGRDTMLVKAPRIDFTADINSILSKDMHLSDLKATSPVITVTKYKDTTGAKPPGATALRIDRFSASEPVLRVASYKNDSATVISIPASSSTSIMGSGIAMNMEGLRLDRFTLNTTSATIVKATGDTLGVEKGQVDLDLSDIYLARGGDKPAWSAMVNALYLKNPNMLTVGKKRNRLFMEQASIGNLRLSSEYLGDVNRLIKYNVSAWLRTATGQYIDSTTTLKWFNAGYDYKDRTLSLDSFTYYPTQPRDSVIAKTPFQTDYITFQSGPLTITDFNLEKYQQDSAILAHTISVTRPQITVYRDKLPPFLSGKIKPLPVDMIKNIRLPVSVQRFNMIDGTLAYSEKNAKTRAEGTLVLNHLNGGLSNIKNRNHSEKDSLLLAVTGYLMDSALISLRVKESYADTLNGFLMTLRLRPTTLSFLNPVLAPLSNVKITSGTIDSFYLRAIGRDDLAFGEMKMFYRDLRIKLIKDGDAEKTSFFKNVISWAANAFLIKKNNNGRTGLVYFKRLRDRSFFNYIVKMTFSGMATSIGVIKNRKYLRKYKKELAERDLPPIDFE